MTSEKFTHITLTATLAILINACSPYAGTRKMERKTSIGYAAAKSRELTTTSPSGSKIKTFGVLGGAEIAVFVVGLIFTEADKAVTKARKGDYKAVGRQLAGTGTFPNNGYLVLARTISDPDNKFPEIAGVKDFINYTPGTAGADLVRTISKSANITPESLRATFKNSVSPDRDNNDKISMLTLCEVVPLTGNSTSTGLYGVTFGGLYYPLLAGSRFAGESTDIFTRISKSKEAMLLEIYGPNGSGYTTGIIKVPLAWSPPGKRGERAPWLTGDDLLRAYANTNNEDQIKELEELLKQNSTERLDRRQAFVEPKGISISTLRGDYMVSETSEATGWILKAVGKAKDAAEGAVSDD